MRFLHIYDQEPSKLIPAEPVPAVKSYGQRRRAPRVRDFSSTRLLFFQTKELCRQLESRRLRVRSLELIECLYLPQDAGHVVGAEQMKVKAHYVNPITPEALVAKGTRNSRLS
jgi:hypothetical protein